VAVSAVISAHSNTPLAWTVEQGTDCRAPLGTTGESPTRDHAEHERVIATVAERSRGRIKVMPGTGSNSTRDAVRLTKFAKRPGPEATDKPACKGQNACKGKGGCKTEKNACKGHNAGKGTGGCATDGKAHTQPTQKPA